MQENETYVGTYRNTSLQKQKPLHTKSFPSRQVGIIGNLNPEKDSRITEEVIGDDHIGQLWMNYPIRDRILQNYSHIQKLLPSSEQLGGCLQIPKIVFRYFTKTT
jgi:hypothetical protein